MIYFIGDKASKKNTDKNVAFVGTRYHLLQTNDDRIWSSFDVVIALGNEASKALTKENIPHLKIPHPSGKNYLLNDKKAVDKFLKQCKDYIGVNSAS